MKRKEYKMFGLTKKMFMGLLISIGNASNYTKCVFLSNQKCIIQPTLINLHPNKYSKEFHPYPLNDLSNKVCVPNKIKDLNLSEFNMIIGINESKLLTKDISLRM